LKNNFVNLTTSDLTQIDQFYPEAEQFSGKGDYWRTAANAYGDMRYTCPGINVSSMISSHGNDNNWNYQYALLLFILPHFLLTSPAGMFSSQPTLHLALA
jgi:hypothetical protein